MENLIQAFGIDTKLIISQIFNFVVLLGLLSYFLYKPILNLLNDREENIKQGIQDAEAAAKARAVAEDEKQVILTNAHQSAEEVANRARESAKSNTNLLMAEAEAKAQATLKEAEVKAEQLRLKITQEAEAQIAKTAILTAEKILRERTS